MQLTGRARVHDARVWSVQFMNFIQKFREAGDYCRVAISVISLGLLHSDVAMVLQSITIKF